MFIQPKKIKGKTYFYLVHSVRKNKTITKGFEKYLGTKEKVDALFEQYKGVRG